MQGNIPHDAVDSNTENFPVKIGGRAATSAPTAVTTGDAVNAYFDANGRQIVSFGSTAAAGDATTNPTTAQIAAFQHGYNGATWDRLRAANVFKFVDALAITGEATVWTPAAGKKFRVLGYHLSASVAGNVLIKDGSSGSTILVIPSGAGGAGVHVTLGNGLLSATADNLLRAIGPATATLSGVVYGVEE